MDIRARAESAGVVGSSGVPLFRRLERRVSVVIANGVETEPLLSADRALLSQETEAVLQGLSQVAAVVEAEQLLLAVRATDGASLRALAKLQRRFPAIQVRTVEDVWPVGEASLLTLRLTGRQVPAGALPEDVGVMVLGIPTLAGLAQAARGLPMLARALTVTGLVGRPQVCRAPLGMPFQQVLDACGGLTHPDAVLWEGGPLLGQPTSLQHGVRSSTTALLALPPDHPVVTRRALPLEVQVQRAASSCGGCRQCTDRCPAWLAGGAISPHRLMRGLVHRLDSEPELVLGAGVCLGCRVCEVICPAGLSPAQLYGVVRGDLQARGLAQLPVRPSESARAEAADRQVDRTWLVERLGLSRWDVPLPFASSMLKATRVTLGGTGRARALVEPGQRVAEAQLVLLEDSGRRWFSPGAGQVERFTEGRLSLILDA